MSSPTCEERTDAHRSGLIAAAAADTHATLLDVVRPHLDRVLAASADG